MKALKNGIRNIAGSWGYDIRKKPVKEDSKIKEERELNEFLQKAHWLKEYNINTILDIGANEGQFAKKINSLLPDARLHCFEPLSDPFKQLQQNFIDNKNVWLHPFALGDKEETLTINVNEYTPSSSFLKMEDNHKKNFTYAVATTLCNVHVKRLDSIDLNLDKNVLIKIDVQGFEDKVIAGGLEIIKKAKVIIIEVTFKELYENQPLFNSIYEKLYKLGFKYCGNFEQLFSPFTGEILQADAIFINNTI